jgi:hypothetical protein
VSTVNNHQECFSTLEAHQPIIAYKTLSDRLYDFALLMTKCLAIAQFKTLANTWQKFYAEY